LVIFIGHREKYNIHFLMSFTTTGRIKLDSNDTEGMFSVSLQLI